ncbi:MULTISPECIES: hypothetical protein [Streptomyces]|uniref:hypothetical protein n=1 Tax=Streptomyces TaxID=1883 RepID=UPI00136BDD7D|nr:hypothetical protein [Streptomyces sp. SID2888]MYV47144.1 hypothetical protein [Streptomyces sp. SID2888]
MYPRVCIETSGRGVVAQAGSVLLVETNREAGIGGLRGALTYQSDLLETGRGEIEEAVSAVLFRDGRDIRPTRCDGNRDRPAMATAYLKSGAAANLLGGLMVREAE